jgi:hypothetical protein
MLHIFLKDFHLHVVGFVVGRDIRDLGEQSLYLLVLLVPLAHFVFYVLRSGLFDGGIEDFFLDGSVHFQGVFYLTEGAGLLFTVALFQLFFLLEQLFDRRMIRFSTTQLRPGAPSFIRVTSRVREKIADRRIARIRFSPTVRHALLPELTNSVAE